ncbi:hypothetical protein EMIHUDRAFT_202849 [Emiliania huxleyi CCMP1516]|uniref:Uncharacterized protein n=2 Tax=Emiliania huxleyi TaxID=2903 RepID=A0A0D3K8X1_EMIH1|nr:hypothetical protein EMIHUDRAFT_202849 [Emiliania huxleyi CCMP1516]EOD32206.1 hypothetical protein EMIHUDRAFT_202849 [Emiliania huxleyi CCMP1516]|eukprot:XP_005784635.1 hypothetical protein EMIHUDRAFT_202849 [Emiliania huxleyi CCMP1516]
MRLTTAAAVALTLQTHGCCSTQDSTTDDRCSATSDAWAAAGLADRFAVVHHHILTPDMVQQLLAAMPSLLSDSAWWMPLVDDAGKRRTPRSAVEEVLYHIYEADFGGQSTAVIGAEWWFRNTTASAGQDAHWDKDQALLEKESRIRFPEVGTVTYLSSGGTPTLVLDQRFGDDACLKVPGAVCPSSMDPPLAKEGLLVYGEPTSHLVFRGNLLHGVPHELAPQTTDDEARRFVLAVNWWSGSKPASEGSLPCVPLSDADWRRRGLYRTDGHPVRSVPTAHRIRGPAELPPLPMRLALTRAATSVALHPSRTVMMEHSFPPPHELPRKGEFHVRWPADAARGPIDISSLHDAAARGDASLLRSRLMHSSAVVDELDERHLTPLHVACLRGQAAAAAVLLERGADADATDAHGSTPLHLAALGAHTQIAELLVAAGCRTGSVDRWRKSPLENAKLQLKRLQQDGAFGKAGSDKARQIKRWTSEQLYNVFEPGRPVALHRLESLFSQEEAAELVQLAEAGSAFDTQADTADGEPSFELYLLRDGRDALVIEGVYEPEGNADTAVWESVRRRVEDCVTPFVRKHFCRRCVPCTSLVRRYRPGAERSRLPPHRDVQAAVTAVVELHLAVGAAAVHNFELLHGVNASCEEAGGCARYSLVVWFQIGDVACAAGHRWPGEARAAMIEKALPAFARGARKRLSAAVDDAAARRARALKREAIGRSAARRAMAAHADAAGRLDERTFYAALKTLFDSEP